MQDFLGKEIKVGSIVIAAISGSKVAKDLEKYVVCAIGKKKLSIIKLQTAIEYDGSSSLKEFQTWGRYSRYPHQVVVANLQLWQTGATAYLDAVAKQGRKK